MILKNVRSIILASGTLHPLESLAAEFQMPFPRKLENEHVIDADQVNITVIKRGTTGRLLNSSFENRSKAEYKMELGSTIVSLLKIIPDGVLVFFPSYSALLDCTSHWRAEAGGDLWKRMGIAKVRM